MKDERKKQIIKAALKRFVKHGISKTSLDEIARDVRIGKATLYYYFKSKEELYQETLKYEISIYFEEISSLFCRSEISYEEKKNEYFLLKQNIKSKFVLINRLIENVLMENLLENEIIILKNFNKKEFSIVKTAIAESENTSSEKIENEVNSLIIFGWGNYFLKHLQITEEKQINNEK